MQKRKKNRLLKNVPACKIKIFITEMNGKNVLRSVSYYVNIRLVTTNRIVFNQPPFSFFLLSTFI